MTSNPFYLYQGTLYKIPTSEKEHGLFHIDMATIPSAEVKSTSRPLHPKGATTTTQAGTWRNYKDD